MTIARRTLLTGLIALAAPAVIRTPRLLMPVRRVVWPDDQRPIFIRTGSEPVMSDAEAERFWLASLRRINDPENLALNHVRVETLPNGTSIRSGWREFAGLLPWLTT